MREEGKQDIRPCLFFFLEKQQQRKQQKQLDIPSVHVFIDTRWLSDWEKQILTI
jgi:hypothetical protein